MGAFPILLLGGAAVAAIAAASSKKHRGGPTPSPQNPGGLDPGIDPQTQAAVLQALATETDPAKLYALAAAIQLKYPIAAALLAAKAQQLQGIAPPANGGGGGGGGMPPPGVQPSSPQDVPVNPATGLPQINGGVQLNWGDQPYFSMLASDQQDAVANALVTWFYSHRNTGASVDVSWLGRGQALDVSSLADEGNFTLLVDYFQTSIGMASGTTPGQYAGIYDAGVDAALRGYAGARNQGASPDAANQSAGDSAAAASGPAPVSNPFATQTPDTSRAPRPAVATTTTLRISAPSLFSV